MTYILGSVCTDGVVLVSDRKITLDSGASHEYEDKLYAINDWMVVGSSGVSGLFEKFKNSVHGYIDSPNRENTVPAITEEIEKITCDINEKYSEKLSGHCFDVLLGIKSSTGAVLQYIYPIGFTERVRKYKVIGHGEPYGSCFLKQWWKPKMTMLQVAELGFFIIKYIQELQLDNTVGIEEYPQVLIIPNEIPSENASVEQIKLLNPYQLNEDSAHLMREKILEKIKEIKKLSWNIG